MFIVAAFFFPLSVYFLVLSLINRRTRPLLVPATWDFAGILFATSGFLASTAPAMMLSACEYLRKLWLANALHTVSAHAVGKDQPASGQTSWLMDVLYTVGDRYDAWLAVYFLGIVIMALLILRRRRHQTAVYNVDPQVFEEVLAATLDILEVTWSRVGQHYDLRHFPKVVSGETRFPEAPPQSAILELDLSPALRHVTLRWQGEDASLKRLVEEELARTLARVRTRYNPVGLWLLGLSFFLLLLTFLSAVVGLILLRLS